MLVPPNTPIPGNETTTEQIPVGIRAVLADTKPIYRLGMKKIFAMEDDIRVMAEVETLPHLYVALERFPTDLIMIEEQLIRDGTDVIPELVRRSPKAKLIVQVSERSESATVELYRQGVRGVILRSIPADLLVKCVRKISHGEAWIDNEAIAWLIEAYRSQAIDHTKPSKMPNLSVKQLAIVACISQGMRNKEIAYQFGTTEQVIKNHLRTIYGLCGVSDRLELALYSLHNQLLKKDAEDQATIDPRHYGWGGSLAGKVRSDQTMI